MPTPDSPKPVYSDKSWIASALMGSMPASDGLSEPDYEKIAVSANQNGVAPLLKQALSRLGAWDTCPAHFREQLSYHLHQKVAWDMLRQADLGPLLDKLAMADIPFLLFKGGGLAYTHYEQSYLRDRCDTDILFPDQAVFEQAWAVLEPLGYSRKNTLSGEFVGFQHCCYRLLAKNVNQVLDCHTRVNDYEFFAGALSFDELQKESVPIPGLASSARTPGKVHSLLVACMHRVATIPHGGADRLIWLFDMYVLGKSFRAGEWLEFQDLCIERSLCGSCVHSLHAALKFFPVPVPADVMTRLEAVAVDEPFIPGQEMKRWRYYYHVFKSVPGAGRKARLIREHFLPSPAYLMEKYQTSNRFKLPFLYVHRVFSGFRRYF